MSGYRNVAHFKMLCAQVVQSCDKTGHVDREKVVSVRASFDEIRPGLETEAWDYLRTNLLRALADNEIPQARAWMTLHKAVTSGN